MGRKIKVGRMLICGCCGSYFNVWTGYKDQDQDTGYGICKSCQGGIKERNKEEMDKAIATLAAGLNDKNRASFEGLARDRQEWFVMKAFEEGILTWGIKPFLK